MALRVCRLGRRSVTRERQAVQFSVLSADDLGDAVVDVAEILRFIQRLDLFDKVFTTVDDLINIPCVVCPVLVIDVLVHSSSFLKN